MDWEALIPGKGWIGDYIKYAGKGTDAPAVYHLFLGLGALGLGIGREAWTAWGHDRLYPNFYCCVLGRSTWPHKSTAQRIAKRLVQSYDETRVYSDRFSPEALLQEFGTNSTLGVWIDELGDFVGLMDGKEYMTGLRGDLTELYGCPDFFRISRAQKTYKARDVFFSIFGATTPHWIANKVKERDILGGLFVRFIFVPETPKTFRYDVPPAVPSSERNKILMSLKKLTDKVKQVEFSLDDEAFLAFVDWKRKLEKEATSDEHEAKLSPFYARMQEYALKIAMLLEISEENINGQISLGKMEHSIEIMSQLKTCLRHLIIEEFAQDGYSLNMKKIRELVRKSPGHERRYYQPRAHMKAFDFNPAWESCVAEEWIRFDQKTKTFR